MWQGNPVLTTVLFGLPLGFLSLICYSICCSDIMDADDEEEGMLIAYYYRKEFAKRKFRKPRNFTKLEIFSKKIPRG